MKELKNALSDQASRMRSDSYLVTSYVEKKKESNFYI